MTRRAALVAALCPLVASCGGAHPEPPLEVPPFTVRGRWPEPLEVRYAIEPGEGPLDAQRFRVGIERALRTWERASGARFVPVTPAEADLTLGWRRGRHGDCPSFGVDGSRAHTGGLGPPTFVHFDAERAWPDASTLAAAAVHELGHVLGLGHSPDPRAALFAGRTALALGAADLAGVHSLYGGGDDGPGDLAIEPSDAEPDSAPLPVLRRIAPPERSAWTLFDVDGDGDDELVVWRTDTAGAGALTTYHFAHGPKLERTDGPFYGVTAPQARTGLVRTYDGARYVVARFDTGGEAVRRFDERGRPVVPAFDVDASAWPEEGFVPRLDGDLDGDGRLERVQGLAR